MQLLIAASLVKLGFAHTMHRRAIVIVSSQSRLDYVC